MTSFELATICQVIEKSCQSSMVRACCMDNATDRGLVAEHIVGQVEKAFGHSNVPVPMSKHCRCGREFRPETFYVLGAGGPNARRVCFTCMKDHSAATHSGEPCVPAER